MLRGKAAATIFSYILPGDCERRTIRIKADDFARFPMPAPDYVACSATPSVMVKDEMSRRYAATTRLRGGARQYGAGMAAKRTLL